MTGDMDDFDDVSPAYGAVVAGKYKRACYKHSHNAIIDPDSRIYSVKISYNH